MAENGNGKVGVEPGEGRQQAGQELHWAPRYGGGYERVYPWDWRNMEISTPGERKRIEIKIAQVAQGPRGVGQAHAQVTGGAPPDPLPRWNT